jgi:O-antigen ligase
VYSVVLLGSAFVAIDTNLVLYEAVIVFQALLVMIYVIHAVETRRDVLFVLGLLMVGILIQVGASLLTYVLGSAFDLGVVSTRAVGGRVAGTLGHPNSLGGFLALLLPTAAALVVAPVAHWYRWLAAVTFATGTVVLGLSQSRGGFLAYVAAMIVLAGLVYWRRLVPRTVLVRGSILAIIPLSVQIAVVGSRLMDFDNAAALSRLPLMRLAFAMIQGNAVWGVGANNFAAALDQYVTVEYSTAWISTVHNRYLLSWAETGIIGLVALLWFLVSILRRAFDVVRSSDRFLALVAAGLLAGVFANMIHMNVDIFNSRPLVQLLWLVAGLVIAVERMAVNPTTGTMS